MVNKDSTFLTLCQVFVALFLLSCNAENGVKSGIVCGCSTDEVVQLESSGAVTASSVDGYTFVSVDAGIGKLCSAWDSTFSEGELVLLKGRASLDCKELKSGYGMWVYDLHVDSVEPIDTLYTQGPITIEILKTEDYGAPPGFGYEISHKEKNFSIRQLEVPGLAGTDPFTRREDAVKIAFLVAFKLKNFDDFPTVYLGELAYLKIPM
jgi:hypothetical protein